MLGLDPERFWVLSPRQAMLEIDAADERRTRADELAISAAWLSGMIARAAKPPKLSDLLTRRRGGGKPDPQMYLNGLRWQLPRVSMQDWLGRKTVSSSYSLNSR